MRIAIVGLGMAGAATAAALARRGCSAEVFEQAEEISEVGAGIGVWPNAIRLLYRLGLADDLDRVGTRAAAPTLCAPDGRVIAQLPARASDGIPGYSLHRAQLLSAMVSRVPEGSIHLGKRCVAAAQEEGRVLLSFADGSSDEFDLVIGADGGRSVVLDAVAPDAPPITFANLAAHRGLAPNTPDIALEQTRVWTDQRKYVIVYPVSGGAKINLAAFVPTDGMPSSSWFARGGKPELQAEIEGWDPYLQRIVESLPEVFRWGLYIRDRLPRIVSGHIALVGDAAHLMTPHAGMGAGQSIEDAFALAALIADATPREAAARLQLYQQCRLEHASMVQEMTRRNAQFMHQTFPLKPGEQRPGAIAPAQALLEYDPEREAEALLESVKTRR